jgi:opacity protein-like surface antigen
MRYLQFNDNLEYAAIGVPALGANVLSYDVHTRNSLVGFQVGGRADYCVGCRTNLYGLARAGIYNNNARLDSRLGSEIYTAYRTGDPTMPYTFSRSTNQLAFLSELGAGVGYRFSPKWTATCGYRAIVASGVATAVGNVRHQGQTISGTGIRSQDYLVLHGVNIGALYNF